MTEKIKTFFYYLLLPFAILGAVIWALFNKTQGLREQVAEKDAELKGIKAQQAIDQADKEANDAEKKFHDTVDKYSGSNGSGQSRPNNDSTPSV